MITLSALEFMRPHRVPVYTQREAAECGLVCLAMVASFHGFETDMAQLRVRFPSSMRGLGLKTILHIANSLKLNARAVRLGVSSIPALALPAVLHWDHKHFVVLVRVRRLFGKFRYMIHDPGTGARWVTSDEMEKKFTGAAVELSRANDFEPKNERRKLRIWQLFSARSGIWRALGNVTALSMTLQIGVLISPLFVKSVVDTALPSTDANLLLVLSIGFFGLSVALTFFTWLRSFVLAMLVNSASFQLSANLIRKLMTLPLQWFTARSVATVIESIHAVKPISDTLAKGLATSFVDGVLAISTLVVMLLLSPKLTLISLIILAIYGIGRWCLFGPLLDLKRALILAEAGEYNIAMETIQGIAPLCQDRCRVT